MEVKTIENRSLEDFKRGPVEIIDFSGSGI